MPYNNSNIIYKLYNVIHAEENITCISIVEKLQLSQLHY